MSPRRKKGEPREIEHKTSADIIVDPVRIEIADEQIVVTWGCQRRYFTVEDLRKQIGLVDLGFRYDMWLTSADTISQSFSVIGDNEGRLWADEREGAKQHGFVSWEVFKRGLQATIAELATTSKATA